MESTERRGRERDKKKKNSSRRAKPCDSSTSPAPPETVPPEGTPPPDPKSKALSYTPTWPQEAQHGPPKDYVQSYHEDHQRQGSAQSYIQAQPGLRSQNYGRDQQSSDMMYSSSFNSNQSWATQSSNTSSARTQTPVEYHQPGYPVSGTNQQQTSGPYGYYSAAPWGYNQEPAASTSLIYPSPASSKSQGRRQDEKER